MNGLLLIMSTPPHFRMFHLFVPHSLTKLPQEVNDIISPKEEETRRIGKAVGKVQLQCRRLRMWQKQRQRWRQRSLPASLQASRVSTL
jgi:hypothetical protein